MPAATNGLVLSLLPSSLFRWGPLSFSFSCFLCLWPLVLHGWLNCLRERNPRMVANYQEPITLWDTFHSLLLPICCPIRCSYLSYYRLVEQIWSSSESKGNPTRSLLPAFLNIARSHWSSVYTSTAFSFCYRSIIDRSFIFSRQVTVV